MEDWYSDRFADVRSERDHVVTSSVQQLRAIAASALRLNGSGDVVTQSRPTGAETRPREATVGRFGRRHERNEPW